MKKKIVQHLKNITASMVLAVLFLAFSLYVGVSAVPRFIINSCSAITKNQTLSEYIELINEQYEGMLTTNFNQELLQNKGTYINLNGMIANLMGQREMNQCVKLNNGQLIGTVSPVSDATLEKVSQNLYALYEHQKANGKNFLFVLAPSKLYQPEGLLPTGFTNYGDESSNQLISLLEQKGVPYLDLRQVLKREGITIPNAFYATDHHWKAETGFWAYSKILEKLAENGSIAPVDTTYTNPENFNFTVYKDAFLGSAGKHTGIYYTGVDDFCVITPKFETEISLKIEDMDVDSHGSFADVALRSDAVAICEKKDYFNHDPYAIYGLSNNAHMYWRNETAPEQQKVLLIGDSYGNVPFSFMSLYFSSCDELDMRYFVENFAEFYNEYSPDHVIVLVNQFGLDTENTLYDYFPAENS